MKYEIRRAVIDDAESLANIIVESWKSAYSSIIPADEMVKFLDKQRRQQQFEKLIQDRQIILIGICRGTPCGLIFANKDNDEQLEECGSIYSMYFLEEYWGKGLAVKLMNKAISILKDEGCRRILLWVYEENERAIGFYERYGFIFDGTKKHSQFSNKPIELRYILDI
ncbi:GNAT family N-acetyltransferase [Tissierella pigra]|uniref:GNAT family N-acetyltransferase n=1 Tax=Tissierella pigra TaxID=2607614 RepID=UPI001C11E607|nr:GNAT family N-acetyltransferase [Tissierella pigra]MBU5425553.1 GNAT family N-acetyltransferase [Tissierella pigra]